MNIDERTRDVIGSILFKMISVAVQEAGQKMQYADWSQLDDRTKANYLNYVEQITSVIQEPVAPPQSFGQAEPDKVEVSSEEKLPAPEEKETRLSEDSGIIQAVIANHPGIEIAPRPPKRNPLECPYCGSLRKSKRSLTAHMKSCKSKT